MKIGIIGAADIAKNKFLPALKEQSDFEYVGLASHSPEKAKRIQEVFGGFIMDSYEKLVACEEIDAVYVALAPAYHYEWGKKVLLAGKHLLMEKPFCISACQTEELLQLAKERGLAIHENYMFAYHSQIERIKQILSNGEIGEIRLASARFGFPKRAETDFRYNKELGGGALLDAGGYTAKLATLLLGDTIRLEYAKLSQPEGMSVDLFGSMAFSNNAGQVVQTAFGMDNEYQCSLEVWGSKGTLKNGRIFTAPDQFEPVVELIQGGNITKLTLEKDNHFLKSIQYFGQCIQDEEERRKHYGEILLQAKLMQEISERGHVVHE